MITPKQAQFVDEYFANNFNATKAYKKVYGCSYNAARSAAARLFNHFAGVQRYYELIKKEMRLQERKKRLSECQSGAMRMKINDIHPLKDCISSKERKELEAIRERIK